MKFIISSIAINLLLSNAQNVNGFSGIHGVQRVGRGGWFKNTNTAARKIDANKNSNSDDDTKRTELSSASTSTAPVEKQVEVNDNDVASIWKMIENQLQEASDSAEEEQKPVLTLYRDTNGWCPFCERIWVCIRAKNLPYQERLISLFDKPEWYKEMVPTTQVPAVLFHEWNAESDSDGKTETEPSSNSRKLVWESIDIMKALDDAFPQTPKLVHDTPEYKAAQDQMDELNKVGFAFLYATRPAANNDKDAGADADADTDTPPLTEEDIESRRQAFISVLDDLEQSLKQTAAGEGEGDANSGPFFRLGNEFSGMDAIMIPTLERWRYQLPLNQNMDILENRPYLTKWFESMEAFTPYSDRVMGDEYSWVATSAMFARYFGGGDDAIERAESLAATLVEGFDDNEDGDDAVDGRGDGDGHAYGKFALEAARKIVSNRDAIIKDCSNADPKSQASIGRCQSADNAEAMMQHVVTSLLNGANADADADSNAGSKDVSSMPLSSELEGMDDDQRKDAALAARTVASRLCVPRDMSAPAAKILRSALMATSKRL